MAIKLREHQIEALGLMHNGCILCGGTGSGKSITSIAYYIKATEKKKKLYIITTARKRDSLEWEGELLPFLLNDSTVIDSWNNIKKYADVKDAFFIFDEQRVVGTGAWVRTFLKITRYNEWILLSATPGDKWEDYIPVFIANGFYRNRTEFANEHMVIDRRGPYPKLLRYLNTGRLLRLRNNVLVPMDFERSTEQIHSDIYTDYNIKRYKDVMKNRWNYEDNEPIENASELCYILRRICNSDPSRATAVWNLACDRDRLIIFYNYDYELELLHNVFDGTQFEVAEWNGHKHQPVPDSPTWIYLVQYNAGSEAWNCIKTDTIIFFSQNYSYKMMIQASGRIDRLNTPYQKLYYYHMKTHSSIDVAIAKALHSKKKFNEMKFGS